MIISCPSCTTRYQWSEGATQDRMTITCQVCGHGWTQNHVIDVRPIISRQLPVVSDIDHGFEPELEVKRLVEAARDAKDHYVTLKKQKQKRLRAWLALAVFSLTPILGAAAYPSAVVRIAPVSIKAYAALGYNINIYGLEVRRVSQQYAMIEGQRVLTIKGDIINITSVTQKIPALRFGLQDQANVEVYKWTLDTGSRPLRVGETTSFVTRVASPPETAQHVKIRFAHAEEVITNSTP